jgi:flagellar FliL protein
MADNRDELDLEGSETIGEAGPSKSGGGLGAILPTILKFAAIGLGALIFIATVSIITYRIMSGSGSAQSAVPTTESYVTAKPTLSWFTTIGVIRTRTKDPTPYSVVVNVILGYDLDSKVAQNELTNRLYQIKDFIRNYFSKKTAADLKPENEQAIKAEIIELLNQNILKDARMRDVLFQQLDVVEM